MNVHRFIGMLILSSVVGCQSFNLDNLRFQSPDKDEEVEDSFETKVETPLIGEYTTIAGLNKIILEGVGLVTGLDGTGDDPPPSTYRTALLTEMRRRGVKSPNMILKSPSTALVVVRAELPPLVKKGERFDIQVRLPSKSEATSLNGGRLLETYLWERAIVPGRGLMKGHVFAKAAGAILISSGEGGSKASLAGVLLRGRVLGGGMAIKEDRDLSLYLRNDFRSVRNSRRIAERIGKRFHHYDRYGLKESLAEAKTDQLVVLKVHPNYKDNFQRYLQVVRNIAFRETEVARRVRMQKLQNQLHDPVTAQKAAVKLEAIGKEAIPILKSGLKHESLETRFHSAMALAYLEEPDGVKVLAEAAKEESAFRVFALASLSTIDEPETHIALRGLMSEKSSETRYGAFRALWTLDKRDPFISGKDMNGQFSLHVIDTQGPALIHLTHRRRAEIVVFGADQKFMTPMTVRAGKYILVTGSSGSDTITVSRYEKGKPDRRRVVSARVADVIQTVAEFGASYPDVAQLLAQADRQQNVPGFIEIDALPQSGRYYYRGTKAVAKNSSRKSRVGRSNLVPNLFNSLSDDKALKQREKLGDDEPVIQATSFETSGEEGTASLADVSEDSKDETKSKKEAKKKSASKLKFLKLFGKE